MHVGQCTRPRSLKMDGVEQSKHSVWSREAHSGWTIFPALWWKSWVHGNPIPCDDIWAELRFSLGSQQEIEWWIRDEQASWLPGQRFSVSSLWTTSAKLVLAAEKSAEDFVSPWNQAQIMNSDFPKNYHVRLKARELPKWNHMPCVKEVKDSGEFYRIKLAREFKHLKKMSSNRYEYKIEQPRDPHIRVEKMEWGKFRLTSWGVAGSRLPGSN